MDMDDEHHDAARMALEMRRRLARIERQRARIAPDAWRTIFRQMRTLCEQLIDQPFIREDAESMTRLGAVLSAPDLATLDERVSHLGRRVEERLRDRARQQGVPEEALPRLLAMTMSSPDTSRLQAEAGPSGDDFILSGDDPRTAPRPMHRGILRL